MRRKQNVRPCCWQRMNCQGCDGGSRVELSVRLCCGCQVDGLVGGKAQAIWQGRSEV